MLARVNLYVSYGPARCWIRDDRLGRLPVGERHSAQSIQCYIGVRIRALRKSVLSEYSGEFARQRGNTIAGMSGRSKSYGMAGLILLLRGLESIHGGWGSRTKTIIYPAHPRV